MSEIIGSIVSMTSYLSSLSKYKLFNSTFNSYSLCITLSDVGIKDSRHHRSVQSINLIRAVNITSLRMFRTPGMRILVYLCSSHRGHVQHGRKDLIEVLMTSVTSYSRRVLLYSRNIYSYLWDFLTELAADNMLSWITVILAHLLDPAGTIIAVLLNTLHTARKIFYLLTYLLSYLVDPAGVVL